MVKPVLLTVDDDPEVLRAIERDLRRHFADRYRVMRADSGKVALSTFDKLDWATFQFTTEEGGNVAPEELESATRELDERTYRQEFQAKFENLTAGRVYWRDTARSRKAPSSPASRN